MIYVLTKYGWLSKTEKSHAGNDDLIACLDKEKRQVVATQILWISIYGYDGLLDKKDKGLKNIFE